MINLLERLNGRTDWKEGWNDSCPILRQNLINHTADGRVVADTGVLSKVSKMVSEFEWREKFPCVVF